MLKSPKTIVSGVILLLVVVLLSLPDRTAAQLKLAISSFFVPLIRLESSAKSAVERAGNRIVPRKVLIEQVEKLTEENTRFQVENQQLRLLEKENGALRQMLDFPLREKWEFVGANVIGADPMNFWRTVQIDRGRDDGLHVDMPVLSLNGFLVGKISEVYLGHSQAVLLGDPKCKISGMIFETGESGIIGPRASLDRQSVNFVYLPNSHSLERDQWVVTSGKGEVFPKGIPIGTVQDWRPSADGAHTEARVKLAAKLNPLEHVMVLVQ